jgi:hypothetical protein
MLLVAVAPDATNATIKRSTSNRTDEHDKKNEYATAFFSFLFNAFLRALFLFFFFSSHFFALFSRVFSALPHVMKYYFR